MQRGDIAFWGLMVVALLLFCIDSWRPLEQMDDAYISFQYARNLVAGHGLVFNIGERVEGFTNLLWTLLIALGMKVGFGAPEVCRVLSFVASASLLVATGIYSALFLPHSRRWLAGFAPLLLLASNAFACWTASGLETALFGLFILLALHALLRERIFLVVCWCVLATLTRPEGALYAAVILGLDWLLKNYRLPNKSARAVFINTYPIFVYLAFVAGYTLWRLWYYGDPLPNTFYAKAGGIPLYRGLLYVYNFVIDGPGWLAIPALIAALKLPAYRLPFICILITVLYSIAVGGDAFRAGRFLLPILPIAIAGAVAGIGYMLTVKRTYGFVLALLLPLTAAWSLYGPLIGEDYRNSAKLPFPALSKRISVQNHAGFGGTAATKRLLRGIIASVPQVKQVACIGIGQFAFFSNGIYVLDLVGLVDKHIAHSRKVVDGKVFLLPGHQRTDADYVLNRRPDIIVIPRKDEVLPLNLPSVYDLWKNPRLEQLYYWDDSIPAYVSRALQSQ
ncbi:MAG TPA: hypothetical protein VLC91_14465 [Spongiibacteraceae bacterium]|nr:hypothetical protein [Spongiibacteraceae bacterium]